MNLKRPCTNCFLILRVYSQKCCSSAQIKITLFQELFLLLSPFLRFANIFSFPFANACFRQNIVVQVQDIGSSHLEAFCNFGVPPISDKSYSLKILENTS